MYEKLTETLSHYETIVFVGGGTGGHIQPILSLAEKGGILSQGTRPGKKQKFLWIGGGNSQEEKAAKENHLEFASIPTLKLSTTRSPKILLYPFVLIRGILEARSILQKISGIETSRGFSIKEYILSALNSFGNYHPKEKSDTGMDHTEENVSIAVFSKGGPGSVAIGIAAWTLHIPLYIHESDTIPGRSNRILSLFSKKVFLGFESSRQYFHTQECIYLGQILSGVFSQSSDNGSPKISPIKWKKDKSHLLILCGSQGSRIIFEEILLHLEEIIKKYEIILVLGKLNEDMRERFESKISQSQDSSILDSLTLLDWISQPDLAHIIPETDIAITRGSATTLAELTYRQSSIHLIIIPLPYAAENHQYWNAKEYEKLGHTLLNQQNLSYLPYILTQSGQNSIPSNI